MNCLYGYYLTEAVEQHSVLDEELARLGHDLRLSQRHTHAQTLSVVLK